MENQSFIKGIYLVAGLRFHPTISDFLEAIEQSFAGGIRLFQLRLKEELSDQDQLELSHQVRKLSHQYGVKFFINDRPDIARLCDADGLHLGPEDMAPSEARKITGNIIIGKSSHTFEQAQSALKEEISYLSVGPVFETDCKKKPDTVMGTDLLTQVKKLTEIPLVAIGGITLQNINEVQKTRVGCCGLIRGIMRSHDIKKAATDYIGAFNRKKP